MLFKIQNSELIRVPFFHKKIKKEKYYIIFRNLILIDSFIFASRCLFVRYEWVRDKKTVYIIKYVFDVFRQSQEDLYYKTYVDLLKTQNNINDYPQIVLKSPEGT